MVAVPEPTFMKCLALTLDYYHKNKKDCQTFNHCFVGNLALMFAARPVEIKLHNPTLYDQVFSILFSKRWVSLEYASPSTLELLLAALSSGHLGRREREMALRVSRLIENQAAELKTTKVQVYNAIWRWQPYSNEILFKDIYERFFTSKAEQTEVQDVDMGLATPDQFA